MKKKFELTTAYLNLISALLILLWIYTAMSKLADFHDFKRQIYNQIFGHYLAMLIIWCLPITEIATALLLCFKKSQKLGLIISFILMLLFTIYIALVLANYFDRTPCSCGGVIRSLGWQAHFWFNLFFLLLSGLGIWLIIQLRNLRN